MASWTEFTLLAPRIATILSADIVGAASVEVVDDGLDVTVWRTGSDQRVIRKN